MNNTVHAQRSKSDKFGLCKLKDGMISRLQQQNNIQCFIFDFNSKQNAHVKSLAITHKSSHYANTPMQYTAIFHGCKNVNFQMKKYNIFLIFDQNID